MLVRPGTYFNPQTEIVVIVDDSTSIDQEIFNMEAYEGSDWVRVSDEVPVDEDSLDADARGVPDPLPRRRPPGSVSATALEQGDGTDDEEEDGRGPGAGTGGLSWPATRSPSARTPSTAMAQWPGFGEMRWYTEAAGCEQVSFSWRSMPPGHRRQGQLRAPPPGPGGDLLRARGHGHVQGRRRGLRGRPAGPRCRIGEEPRSVHNDTDDGGRADHRSRPRRAATGETEKTDTDFWPEAD